MRTCSRRNNEAPRATLIQARVTFQGVLPPTSHASQFYPIGGYNSAYELGEDENIQSIKQCETTNFLNTSEQNVITEGKFGRGMKVHGNSLINTGFDISNSTLTLSQ